MCNVRRDFNSSFHSTISVSFILNDDFCCKWLLLIIKGERFSTKSYKDKLTGQCGRINNLYNKQLRIILNLKCDVLIDT